MRYSILSILILLLVGCIPTYKLSRPHLIYEKQQGAKPPLNKTSLADSGDVIYTEFEYRVNPAVKLDEDVKTKYRNLQAHTRLSKMKKGHQLIYGTVSISDRSVTYLRDHNNDGKFDQILVQARKNATNWTDISPEVVYHKVKGLRSENGGFETDIIYLGEKDSTISFSYQEYKKDLTSPAHQKVIHYRMGSKKQNIFSIHHARIKVLNVSGKELKYKILSGFKNS